MTRSNFPNAVDSLPELSNLLASDKTNVDRYKVLLMQESRTTAEETELNNLKTILANKLIDAEFFNFLSDAIVAVQNYFLNEVRADLATLDVGVLRNDMDDAQLKITNVDTKVGLISTLKTSDKTDTVNAINEVYDALITEKTTVDNHEEMITTMEPKVTNHETRIAKLEDNTVTFFTPTLFNGWVPNGSAYPPKYWKDKDGIVHYRLWLKDGSPSLNVVVMNFPVGYRPAANEGKFGFNDNSNAQNIIYHVATNGEMKFLRSFTAGASIILNGSFKAV